MSDENVGRLPELPEPIDAIARNAWGPKPDYYTADQMQAYARAAVSAHGQPVVDAVPPEAVKVEGTALLAGAVKLGDWAIPTQCGARIVDARMAYGWNECRKAMLKAIAALTGATP